MTKDEILAKLQELGHLKDKIRTEMIELRAEFDRLVAEEKANKILEKLPPDMRDVFVKVAAAVAKAKVS